MIRKLRNHKLKTTLGSTSVPKMEKNMLTSLSVQDNSLILVCYQETSWKYHRKTVNGIPKAWLWKSQETSKFVWNYQIINPRLRTIQLSRLSLYGSQLLTIGWRKAWGFSSTITLQSQATFIILFWDSLGRKLYSISKYLRRFKYRVFQDWTFIKKRQLEKLWDNPCAWFKVHRALVRLWQVQVLCITW